MIGIDLEQVNRFTNYTSKNLMRLFAPAELEYANNLPNKFEHLAGFYCVKESLVKALDDKSLKFNKIEVLHTASGKPCLNQNAYIKSVLKKYNYSVADISISHTKDYAIAIVLLKN